MAKECEVFGIAFYNARIYRAKILRVTLSLTNFMELILMYFLGIDIAKTNHVASLIDNNANIIIRPLPKSKAKLIITNTGDKIKPQTKSTSSVPVSF